jgi:site-specific recombinase XerD
MHDILPYHDSTRVVLPEDAAWTPPDLDGLVTLAPRPPDRHPATVYLARLAPGSRRTMRAALETIAQLLTGGQATAASLAWGALRYQHTAAVRAVLAERYAPATANKLLAALRGVLHEAWRLGDLEAEAYQRAADLPAVRGERLPQGRALAMGELRALFQVCQVDRTPAGARDAALLAVLYGSGLRRAEVVALELADYDRDAGALTIRRGKGRKDRLSYVTEGSARALAAWLAVRGPEPGPLLYPVTKGGRLVRRRLTDQAVLWVLRKRAAEATVAHFSPHDLRRTFISLLLDAGADLATVQRLAGHANVQTTARYDRRGEAAKRQAVALLHVPYEA